MSEIFDVALSFSFDDAWLARDISALLERYGVRTYCSANAPDLASGALRKKLSGIYRDSSLNVMLWTPSYAGKARDTVTFMERNILWSRHFGKSDLDTLMIASLGAVDPFPDEFEDCLTHSIETVGVVGIVDFCVSRLIKLRSTMPAGGPKIQHPLGSEIQRGQMLPCKVRISPTYETDHLQRWKSLGDIEVIVVGKNETHLRDYLIPSGAVAPYLGHSTLLRERPDCLALKQAAGRRFTSSFAHTELDAVRFFIERHGVKYPHVYCAEYDKALNSN